MVWPSCRLFRVSLKDFGIVQDGLFNKEERKSALMAALLLPLRNKTVPLKGKRSQPLTSYLILQSIKWRTVDAECIQHTHTEASSLLSAFEQLQVYRLLVEDCSRKAS